MLNIGIIRNAAGAKKYFEPEGHDYWIEDRDTRAFFGGRLAGELGLGEFDLAKLHALLDGNHPLTGEKLTPGGKENRRAGYEVTLDGPKDLGVLMALGMDDRIIPEVLERATRDVMAVIEMDAKTRVRKGGKDADRSTGNMAWAGVLHLTARPVDGKIDVQPHYHVLVGNVTYDPVEKRYKAVQLQPWALNGAKEARPFYMAYFNAQLARYMGELGYQTERAGDSFRVVGVPERVRKEFSQRRGKILETAAMLDAKLSDEYGPGTKLGRAGFQKLAMTTRERKQPGRSWEYLVSHWTNRISADDLMDVQLTAQEAKPREIEYTNAEALDWGLYHTLERKSVVTERELMTAALRHGIGTATPEGVHQELSARRDLIRRDVDGKPMVSTQGVLGEEKAIVAFAQAKRGKLPLLAPAALSIGGERAIQKARASRPVENPPIDLTDFSLSQREAVKHVWGSRDPLTIVRGGSGTGKTSAVKAMLQGVDVPWVIVAPTATASRGVLRREGFEGAETLAKFLSSEEMQARVKNGLIVLDEASLAGAHDVYRLVNSAEQLNARVVLLGDRRQHKSVARGDVLALLEDRAGLPVAEISEIQRQKGEYKQVAELLQKGKMGVALAKLDAMGWVKESGVVDDYWKALQDGKSALIVVPTHAEGDKLTNAIRGKGHGLGVLKGDDVELPTLRNLNYSHAELEDAKKRKPEGIVITRYGAFKPEAKMLAVGDSIRATAGGKDTRGKRFDGGTMFKVTAIDGDRIDVVGESGVRRTLEDFRNWTHGYVATSQAGQGRTVDRAYLWMPEATFPAVRMDTAYTSGTRGRESVTVYTDDRAGLLDAITQQDMRMLASDLVRKPRKGIREKLKRRVSFLRDLGNHARTKLRDMIHGREMAYER